MRHRCLTKIIIVLVFVSMLMGCSSEKNSQAEKDEVISNEIIKEYEPKVEEISKNHESYVKKTYRLFDVTSFHTEQKRVGAQIYEDMLLLDEQEEVCTANYDKGVYYLVKSLRYTSIYNNEAEIKAFLDCSEAFKNHYAKENYEITKLNTVKYGLYDADGFLTTSFQGSASSGNHSYSGDFVRLNANSGGELVINYVLEFEMVNDDKENYRQPEEVENAELVKRIEEGLLFAEVELERLDKNKGRNGIGGISKLYIIKTENGDYSKLKLEQMQYESFS